MVKAAVKIAVIGFGTVGTGVVKMVQENAEHIYQKTGVWLELSHVVDTDLKRERPVKVVGGQVHDDLQKVLADKEVKIAAELVGGMTAAAEMHKKLLAAGKDVVTANKALLAERGGEIFAAARQYDRCVAFEASCMGGVPVIGAIGTGLAANRIKAMYGIVNGTCNYILSGMSGAGKDYDRALKEAQAAGFAEADPTLDVNGTDSAHKLAILSRLAFGREVDFKDIAVQGIDDVQLADIRYGQELGYELKLLALADQTEKGLSLRVLPAFIRRQEALAQVSGPFNAVSIFADAAGHTFYYGRGAGMMPTASAVVADIIEVALGNAGRDFAARAGFGREAQPATMRSGEETTSQFYLRLSSVDRPGVLARILGVLGEKKISVSGCLQRASRSGEYVPVVITTYQVRQGDMQEAVEELARLEAVQSEPVCIPVAALPSDD
ncbi:MAG: hypothetical protein AMJ79_11360 [Phycisphaerae bacterium SM23_30]|nr:MAG: hypothetical protein AMJ79_11360 [Phycisphaerae bacterium SM23_30]